MTSVQELKLRRASRLEPSSQFTLETTKPPLIANSEESKSLVIIFDTK